MPNMDCWGAAYEGATGKEQIEEELEWLRQDEIWAREHFDALNLDVLIKEQAARQLEFADSERKTNRLANQIGDVDLNIQRLSDEKASYDINSDEFAELAGVIDGLREEKQAMEAERDSYNERFAQLNEIDA